MSTGSMVKVNDRFSFPREMDIDQYLGEVSVCGEGAFRVCVLFHLRCLVLSSWR